MNNECIVNTEDGVAFKLNLLYKLVSVECCGIEQQLSVLVLTLDTGL